MIAHRKTAVVVNGQPFFAILPLRVVDGIVVQDEFGTSPNPRRALSTDRRFISTSDELGHAGRAA